MRKKKKREKPVLESRCRCEKCLLKRRRAKKTSCEPTEPSKVGEGPEEPGAKYALDTVRTRGQTQPHGGSEEIVLKVTNFQH